MKSKTVQRGRKGEGNRRQVTERIVTGTYSRWHEVQSYGEEQRGVKVRCLTGTC